MTLKAPKTKWINPTTSRQPDPPGGAGIALKHEQERHLPIMPGSHETFILWLILSLGIHVATLALWPLPPSWEPGHPTHIVVDLRSTGSGAPKGSNGADIAPRAVVGEPPQPTPVVPTVPSGSPPVKTPDPARAEKHRPVIKMPPSPTPAKKPAGPSSLPGTNVAPSPIIEGIAASDVGDGNTGDSAPSTVPTGSSPSTGVTAGSGSPTGGSGGAFGTGGTMVRATPMGYGDNPAMPYPRTARRRGWQGEVLLRVAVSANGQVLSVHLEKSSGYGILDDTALEQVAGWRFRPASRNGIPAADTVLVPVQFKLHDR